MANLACREFIDFRDSRMKMKVVVFESCLRFITATNGGALKSVDLPKKEALDLFQFLTTAIETHWELPVPATENTLLILRSKGDDQKFTAHHMEDMGDADAYAKQCVKEDPASTIFLANLVALYGYDWKTPRPLKGSVA